MSSSPPRSTPTRAPSRGALDDLLAAMDQDTPLAPRVRKRTYAESLGSGDENENNEGLFAPLLRGRNASDQIQRLGEAKRLRPEQIADAVASLNNTPAVQGAKIILAMHEIYTNIGNFAAAKPVFAVSDATETNIYYYAAAVLLSPKLSAYKGSVPINLLLNILKTRRFDLPPNIENTLRSSPPSQKPSAMLSRKHAQNSKRLYVPF
ncbi:hypothetical protein GGX14DRAFT_577981 [Mycena pura]|uniref:Uncharacterized protein n=1 Tax=Mycena pura TaxID=153505 RepID=A0AAD6Y3J1_9AGAR|nr:hypothetical protein GGX14DRAFT_577981 [Mycena pura]